MIELEVWQEGMYIHMNYLTKWTSMWLFTIEPDEWIQ